LLDKHFEICLVGSSIPDISDMASIHDLSKEILEILVRDFLKLAQVVVKNISANSEISVIEVVNSGPAN
jgi:hypothetical protein